jgi:hypothetical protein
MRDDSYRVLVFAGDDRLTQEIASKLREFFVGFPLELEFEPSARRLVSEFKAKLHDLVILAAGGADADMPQTILQLQAVSGSSRILYLGASRLSEGFEGVESFPLPIVQWSALLGLIGEVVPDQLALRYRLKRIENPLRSALEQHASAMLASSTQEASGAADSKSGTGSTGFLLAPLAWRQASPTASFTSSASAVNPGTAPVAAAESGIPKVVEIDPELRRRSLRLELALMGGLLLATTAAHWLSDPDSPDYLISIKSALKLLSAAAVFGFFASRGLEPLLFRKQKTAPHL